MKMEFNLNQYIYVKITEAGYTHLANKHSNFYTEAGIPDQFPEMAKPEYYRNKADRDGYTQMQTWSFIADFGSVTGLGMYDRYRTTILIDDSDLTKYEPKGG